MDKVLGAVGVTATGVSFLDVNHIVSITVGLATVAMIVPRAMMNWDERSEKKERRRMAKDKLARLEEILKVDEDEFPR